MIIFISMYIITSRSLIACAIVEWGSLLKAQGGDLLATSGDMHDAEVISAIVCNVWNSHVHSSGGAGSAAMRHPAAAADAFDHDGSAHAVEDGDADTTRGALDVSLIVCEHGAVAVSRVAHFLLCLYGRSVQLGMLRKKTLVLKAALEDPLAKIPM